MLPSCTCIREVLGCPKWEQRTLSKSHIRENAGIEHKLLQKQMLSLGEISMHCLLAVVHTVQNSNEVHMFAK